MTIMLFSKACEYGIQVVLVLAAAENVGYTPVREIADRCRVPAYYLGKICGKLTQTGVLKSYKGPNGGVALAKLPEKISLLDVFLAIDGDELLERCVMGLEPCSDEQPCPVHDQWVRIKGDIRNMMAGKTLEELAAELESGQTSLRQVLKGS